MTKILHLDASSATATSNSRKMSKALADGLAAKGGEVTYRDLTKSDLKIVTESQIGAYYTPADDRSDEQKADIAQSDALVAELKAADTIVIGLPIYNFSTPAVFKLYEDMIARVGETFYYTEEGPVGLVEGKKIYITVASGGVPLGSPADHLSPQVTTFFNFLGITDIEYIYANSNIPDGENSVAAALEKIENIVA